jgi:hypothetical protein
MAQITLYKQVRRDGGERVGVDVDGERLLDGYRPGTADEDPSLLWYIDVRCTMSNLSSDPTAVQRWLRDNSVVLRAALRTAAQQIGAGLDGPWPLVIPIEPSPLPGVGIRIAASAVRRMDALRLAHEMENLAEQWDAVLDALAVARPAA